MLRSIVTAALAAALLPAAAEAKPGDLDKTFASGGRIAIPYGDSNATPSALSLVDGLRPLVGVRAEQLGRSAPFVQPFSAGGKPAAPTPLPLDTGLVRLSGARWLSGPFGEGTRELPMTLSDGRTLPLPAGSLRPVAFRVDAAGRVLVVGSLGADTVAVRFLGDGTADLAYGIVVLAKQTTAIDGYITAAGRPYVVGSTEKQSAVVAGREGVWRDRGLTWPTAIAPGPGGTVLVAGSGNRRSWIVRLRPGLRRDARFPIVRPRDMIVAALARDAHQRIVVGGMTHDYPKAKLIRLDRRGRGDRRFGTVVKQIGARRKVTLVASEVRHVAIDNRGRIVVAGVAYDDEYVGRDDVGRAYLAVARLKG